MGDRNVLERILSGLEKPTNLSLALLQEITENFSEERKIGEGGFGEVYKGVLQNGNVAVKKIDVNVNTIDDIDKLFRREFNTLMQIINHPNVVRFLGFCYEIRHETVKEARSGNFILAQIRERLLCFEYISNGSLDKHITDELRGLEWDKRYQIIKGICQGLQCLHKEKHIIHMDLKPTNIMLNDEMVPKITDFGLSRPDKNTHTTGILFKSRGYCAPEYENDGKTSTKADMYSLGVIITELVTGCRALPTNNHNVLRRWRHRWNKPPTLLQYQQVTKCMQIAVSCRKSVPDDRPFIWGVIRDLDEVESENGHSGQTSLYSDDDMLGIEPLELHFPFKLNSQISCSIELTNKTKNCFAFNIQTPSMQYSAQPEKGVVQPGCKYHVKITLQPQERAPHATQNVEEFIVQSTNVKEGLADKYINQHMFNYEAGKVVDEVNLTVIYEPEKSQVDPSFKRHAEVLESWRTRLEKSQLDTELEQIRLCTELGIECTDGNQANRPDTSHIINRLDETESTCIVTGVSSSTVTQVQRTLENLEDATNLLPMTNDVCLRNESADKNVTVGQGATEKLRGVQECINGSPHIDVVESVPPSVQEMLGPSMSAKGHNLEEALQFIKDDPVGVIGIWGPGGVGKTHLLNNIKNSLDGDETFDYVIPVTASRGCSVGMIQAVIVKKLKLEKDEDGDVELQRCIIYDFLKKRSFLVLLDDLWDRIDLEAVGIPYPYPLGIGNQLKRKVVLTTRSRKVCGQMEVRKELKVAYMQEDEAWQLFQEKVGHETLTSSPRIEGLARELVEELKGMPLALITIGRAMYAKSDTAEWEYAIQHMKRSCCDNDDPLDMERTVFSQVKFRFDSLRNNTLKDCFLTCALWPEDWKISKEELVRCWIGLGLVDESDIQSSYTKAYSLMGDLSAACLVDSCGKSYDYVKMHDVVRDMALWISCGCGENNGKWFVRAGVGSGHNFSISWCKAEYISLMWNGMEKLPPVGSNTCHMKLRMLCLGHIYLDDSIIAEAINKFTSLTYLDLCSNRLLGIPEEICSLANLEHLDLSFNYDIEEVPHCFGNLTKLKFLYLIQTRIGRIPEGIISSLKALQVIDLRTCSSGDCSVDFLSRRFQELGTLPHLKAVGTSTTVFAQFESLGEAANLPIRYLRLLLLKTQALYFSDILSHDFARRTLYKVEFGGCNMEQIIVRQELAQPDYCFGTLSIFMLQDMSHLREVTFMEKSPASLIPKLTFVEVTWCHALNHLSWVTYLPCLEQLKVENCGKMRQAFMSHHGDNMCSGQESSKTFPCLKYLRFRYCKSLVTIGDPDVTFPALERLEIAHCPELRRLPFQMDSLPLKLRVLKMDVGSWEGLELEEGVKSFLQPKLKFVG